MAPGEDRKSLVILDITGAQICAFIVGVNQDFSVSSQNRGGRKQPLASLAQ
jgi:hypothetical protein